MDIKICIFYSCVRFYFLPLTLTRVRADINSDCQNESAEQLVKEGKVDQCSQILQGIANSISAANSTNQKKFISTSKAT